MGKKSILRFVALALICCACGHPEKKEDEGLSLARTYCGSCHKVPPPDHLDKNSWLTGVLPQMGPRLGISSFQGSQYRRNAAAPPQFYPDQPIISQDEWNKIVNYFYDNAPDTLTHVYPPIDPKLDLFEARTPHYPQEVPPVTCYIRIDPGNHGILASDGVTFKLRSFNSGLRIVGEVPTSKAASDVAFADIKKPGSQQATLLNMGVLNPNDVTSGSLQSLTVGAGLQLTVSGKKLIDSLPRPVFMKQIDLDADGKDDFVVCGFGNYLGSLFWLKNSGDHYEKKMLRNLPGSMQAIAEDFTHDGKPDILALMAQGDEGIFLYVNQGNGSFEEKSLLRFSPEYGSISMDLGDFNNDGFPDIVYACGDNADYSKILKPYHGVYIFLNDGKWNFKQAYFFPINGCFKVLARDFDLDGDIDLATISFFPDFKRRAEESFVYLRNEGHLTFTAHTFPQYGIGRWLTMDAGDVDGDGDQDLVLGNMSIGPTNIQVNQNWKKGPAFVLLENKTK
jgi:hypothetical protein